MYVIFFYTYLILAVLKYSNLHQSIELFWLETNTTSTDIILPWVEIL